jgi:hypothetical protein
MMDESVLGNALNLAGHAALGWTVLSCMAAGAWCVFCMPGRAQRLALEDARVLATWQNSQARSPASLRKAA